MNASLRRVGALCWVALLGAVPLSAQREDYGSRLGRIETGQPIYYSAGTGLRMEAVYPSLQKWYLPQEIAGEYRRQWAYTNYARDPYRRYLDPGLEGGYFYDLYGRFLNKGWLIYDWRQDPADRLGRVGHFAGRPIRLVVPQLGHCRRHQGPALLFGAHRRRDLRHADAHDLSQDRVQRGYVQLRG